MKQYYFFDFIFLILFATSCEKDHIKTGSNPPVDPNVNYDYYVSFIINNDSKQNFEFRNNIKGYSNNVVSDTSDCGILQNFKFYTHTAEFKISSLNILNFNISFLGCIEQGDENELIKVGRYDYFSSYIKKGVTISYVDANKDAWSTDFGDNSFPGNRLDIVTIGDTDTDIISKKSIIGTFTARLYNLDSYIYSKNKYIDVKGSFKTRIIAK